MVRAGGFREDLYFRLNVVEITIPPLRERREDIPVLVQYLLEKINRELHRCISRVPESVLQQLAAYAWPGNVRELENVLTQAALRTQRRHADAGLCPRCPRRRRRPSGS